MSLIYESCLSYKRTRNYTCYCLLLNCVAAATKLYCHSFATKLMLLLNYCVLQFFTPTASLLNCVAAAAKLYCHSLLL